jgi:O-antigen ligase
MIFPLLAMVGIAMLATDGLSTVEQVERLLKRLVFLTTIQGIVGALEFALHLDYRTLARLPGLVVNTEVGSMVRNGIGRIEAAAAHPIEFSLALATAVPLALHFALNADNARSRRLFWVCFGILAGVIPLTVSRTGLLGLAICIIVYGSVLRGRARANVLVLSAIGLVTFPILAPGVLSTIKNFVFAGTADNSITGRLDDYALIPLLMDGHWWFGRGFGTFQPLVYFFLDNQYLMQLLTGGIISLLAFVAIFVVGASVARGARKRFTRTRDRDLAQAIAAPIVAIAVGAGTFDLFSFLQCAFTLFMLCGCAAALWTISRREECAREAAEGLEATKDASPAADKVLV